MNRPRNHSPRTAVLAVVSILAASALAAFALEISLGEVPPEVSSELGIEGPQSLLGEDGRLPLFIELSEPATAVVYARTLRQLGATEAAEGAANQAARGQLTRNLAQQDQVATQLFGGAVAAQELYRIQRVLNGFMIRVEPEKIPLIGRLAGVKRVHLAPPETLENGSSVPFIGAPPAWGNNLGLGINLRGEGIKVGIIDTGIDYLHANFGGSGLLADYTANDRTVAPDAFFPNAKVVGGRDFAGDNYNAAGNGGTTGTPVPAPDNDPMDCNSHGTHVAGTAAGLGVTAAGATFPGPYDGAVPFGTLSIGPGVAPLASLYGLRVFGCQGSTSLTAQAIDWAADPDGNGDFTDRLDVINLSLGSNYGTVSAASAVAAENASLVGVMVVAASGNAGDTFFITSSPGVADHALSVAASIDSGVPGAVLQINSPGAIAGNYPAAAANFTDPTPPAPPVPSGQTANIVAALDPADGAGPTTFDACSALTNAAAVAGNIALVDRGTCGFNIKVQNVAAAGAAGLIVANNAVGDPVPIAMGGASTVELNFPSIFVSQATGNAIRAQLASVTVNATLAGPSAADTLAGFSSRGPRRHTSPIKLKPEISGPGQTITSSFTGTRFAGGSCAPNCNVTFVAGSLPLNNNGTSMATPHVVGMMALLKQLHPTWTVEELKALAMNYANHDVFLGANSAPPRFGLSRMGSGRMDVAAAAQGEVVAMSADDPGLVSVTFDTQVVGLATQMHTVRVVNHGATAATFNLAFDLLEDAPGISFSLPGGSSVSVPAGGTAEFDVQMSADSALMDHLRDATMAPTQATANAGLAGAIGANTARHWLTEEQAFLTFTNTALGGGPTFRLPVYMAARPASMLAAADTIVTAGAGTGSTTITIAGPDVCTGTLGAGPTCTGTFPNDEVSLVTPFELQIASPRSPSTLPAFADLQYAGAAFTGAAGTPANVVLFGVSTWGEWSTPTDIAFNICVDNNEDGVWDRVVFNSNSGNMSALLGTAANGTDAFINATFTPPGTVSNGGGGAFTNIVSSAGADSALFLTNVAVLGASTTQLGLNSGNTNFRYKVITCPGFNPLCVRTTACAPAAGTFFDQTTGFAFWNHAAQGLSFNGGYLFFDLNGTALPVSWNTTNMSINASLGALLLHHHNADGKRAEVVLLEGTQGADLALTKAMSPPTPTVGANAVFTLTLTNNGPATASGITVSDLLPPGVTYVSDNGGGAYASGTGIWTVPGTLGNGASTSLQITGTVNTSAAVENIAEISTASPLDPNPANNSSKVVVNAPEAADLELTMSASAPTVLVGGSFGIDLTAENLGDDTAFSIAVNELFTGFEPLTPTASSASAGVYNGTTGIWNLPSLGSQTRETATLTLTFTAPNMAGALTNNGTAAASVSDPNNANNAASTSITVLSPADVTATKTVAGLLIPGSAVTYIVTLNNASTFDQQDNPGAEFTDVLPANLTLVSASASSGTVVATVGTNTVTWNGAVPGSGSVTITITATINAGTVGQVVSNQGTAAVDVDGNGVNEASRPSDDPGQPGASDPTVFTVLAPTNVGATKAVTGNFVAGGTVTYTVALVNAGQLPQADNPGAEFTDVLPSELILASATATAGTATADTGTNTVTWNGGLAAGGSVTITIDAVIASGITSGVIANQGSTAFDADSNGSNEAAGLTDDPAAGGAADPTTFVIQGTLEIPTLSWVGLALLMLALAGAAVLVLRRRV